MTYPQSTHATAGHSPPSDNVLPDPAVASGTSLRVASATEELKRGRGVEASQATAQPDPLFSDDEKLQEITTLNLDTESHSPLEDKSSPVPTSPPGAKKTAASQRRHRTAAQLSIRPGQEWRAFQHQFSVNASGKGKRKAGAIDEDVHQPGTSVPPAVCQASQSGPSSSSVPGYVATSYPASTIAAAPIKMVHRLRGSGKGSLTTSRRKIPFFTNEGFTHLENLMNAGSPHDVARRAPKRPREDVEVLEGPNGERLCVIYSNTDAHMELTSQEPLAQVPTAPKSKRRRVQKNDVQHASLANQNSLTLPSTPALPSPTATPMRVPNGYVCSGKTLQLVLHYFGSSGTALPGFCCVNTNTNEPYLVTEKPIQAYLGLTMIVVNTQGSAAMPMMQPPTHSMHDPHSITPYSTSSCVQSNNSGYHSPDDISELVNTIPQTSTMIHTGAYEQSPSQPGFLSYSQPVNLCYSGTPHAENYYPAVTAALQNNSEAPSYFSATADAAHTCYSPEPYISDPAHAPVAEGYQSSTIERHTIFDFEPDACLPQPQPHAALENARLSSVQHGQPSEPHSPPAPTYDEVWSSFIDEKAFGA